MPRKSRRDGLPEESGIPAEVRTARRAAYLGDADGAQPIEDTGPLTKKRMETIDDETVAAAIEFIAEQTKADKPWFVWWNGTRMHFRTHVKG